VKKKSKPPKKAATTKLKPMTIKVYLIVCCRVGQVTRFNSTRTSLRNVIAFLGNWLNFIFDYATSQSLFASGGF